MRCQKGKGTGYWGQLASRAVRRPFRRHGVALVVDNTFTPMIVSPAKLGADVVIYSMTKFISGCSDIIAGAVCGSDAFIKSLMDLHVGERGQAGLKPQAGPEPLPRTSGL